MSPSSPKPAASPSNLMSLCWSYMDRNLSSICPTGTGQILFGVYTGWLYRSRSTRFCQLYQLCIAVSGKPDPCILMAGKSPNCQNAKAQWGGFPHPQTWSHFFHLTLCNPFIKLILHTVTHIHSPHSADSAATPSVTSTSILLSLNIDPLCDTSPIYTQHTYYNKGTVTSELLWTVSLLCVCSSHSLCLRSITSGSFCTHTDVSISGLLCVSVCTVLGG